MSAGAARHGPQLGAANPGRWHARVHGAWHGGWCNRDAAQALSAAGHGLHTPALTLTGLGERAHPSAGTIAL